MKKIILAALLILALAFSSTACDKIVENTDFVFSLLPDGTYEVSLHKSNTSEVIEIPDSHDGKPVTAIGINGFANSETVKEIIVPDSINTIKFRSFANCPNLTRVFIGKGVEKFEKSLTAFGVMSDSTSLNGYFAGSDKVDGSFVVSGSVGANLNTSDKVAAFSISMSADGDAFVGCTGLVSIEVDADNPSFTSIDGNLYSKDAETLIKYAPGKKETSFIIPESVKRLDQNAFANSATLEEVTIPAGFAGVSSSDSSDKSDNPFATAFPGCVKLTEIKIDPKNDKYTAIDGNVYSKDGETFVYYAVGKTETSFTIPGGVKAIGDSAFSAGLSDVYATSVKYDTTTNDTSFSGGVDSAFVSNAATPQNALKLTEIIIPEGVVSIGAFAFAGCADLANLSIPSSIEYISADALSACKKLNYTVKDGLKYLGNKDNPYLVAAGFESKEFSDVVIDASARIILAQAFAKKSEIITVEIPEGVVFIGANAFSDCNHLERVILPTSVKAIGNSAFYGCKNLEVISYLGSSSDFEKIDIDTKNDSDKEPTFPWDKVTVGVPYSSPF